MLLADSTINASRRFVAGGVYDADLPSQDGAEMCGWHPVVLLSARPRYEFGRHVISVVPMTTCKPWLRMQETDVLIETPEAHAAGLNGATVVKVCHHRSLDTVRLACHRGAFPPNVMAIIRAAVRRELDLDE